MRLKIKNINGNQLYRMLQLPEFGGVKTKRTATFYRIKKGKFGRTYSIPTSDEKLAVVIDLDDAYDKYFHKYLTKADYIRAINNWVI